MEVAPSEPERAHAGAPRVPRAPEPRPLPRRDVERRAPRRHRVVGRIDLQRRRHHSVVERERDLDQPGHAGRSLGVPDHRLHRAQRTPGVLGLPIGVVHGGQAPDLGRIADPRPGAVPFDELHRARIDPRDPIRASQRPRLPLGVGRVDRLPLAVARRPDPPHHRVDPIPVALGVRESLEHHDAHALAENRPVRISIERSRVAPLGQRRRLREARVHEHVVEGVHAACEHEVRAPRLELERREVQRRERRRARGIDHAVGPVQVEPIRDPSRGHVAEQPGKRALLPRHILGRDALHDVLRGLFVDAGIPQRPSPQRMAEPSPERDHQLERPGHAEDHRRPPAIERLAARPVARVRESPRRDVQRQELRRVRRLDVPGRDAHLHRRYVHRIEKPTPLGVDLVGRRRIGIEVLVRVPVRRRHLRDRVDPVAQVGPKGGLVASLGKETIDAHDRQRGRGRVRLIHRESSSRVPIGRGATAT